MHTNPTIIHLWQIKEAEYANIDSIISTFKNAWYCAHYKIMRNYFIQVD